MSDEDITAAKLGEIANRALTFQRYIFRRAWRTYYAIWAAAFVVFVFGNFLPSKSSSHRA
ncbi:MAG TPA: hypothetical protein VFF30_01400 [Nitrososphaerales archaeon]|nr:hypothetical protein [Nitrososphaerales archaeon]